MRLYDHFKLFSPSRFEGSLNVDLNEISMNLVPFPRLHYLVSAMSPLFISQDLGLPPRMYNIYYHTYSTHTILLYTNIVAVNI